MQRFVSRDLRMSNCRYSYVDNLPTSLLDMFGLEPQKPGPLSDKWLAQKLEEILFKFSVFGGNVTLDKVHQAMRTDPRLNFDPYIIDSPRPRPDYIVLSGTIGPIGALLPHWVTEAISHGGQLIIDRYGNFYIATIPVSLGASKCQIKGAFGKMSPSGSLAVGYLIGAPVDENFLRVWITEHGWSSGGGWGVGGGMSGAWVNGHQYFSVETGFYSPQVGTSYTYARYVGRIPYFPQW